MANDKLSNGFGGEDNLSTDKRLSPEFQKSVQPNIVTVDVSKYQAYLDDADLTPSTKKNSCRRCDLLLLRSSNSASVFILCRKYVDKMRRAAILSPSPKPIRYYQRHSKILRK